MITTITPADLGLRPGEDIRGLDIGHNPGGWTGNKHAIPVTGGRLHINCEDRYVVGGNSGSNAAINIFPGAGFVEVINARIEVASKIGVNVGQAGVASNPGDYFRLVNSTIVGESGTFGIHSRNYDLDLFRVGFDTNLGQHNVYAGGWSRYGVRVRRSGFVRASSTAEHLKLVWRPVESPRWVRGTRAIIENCSFADAGSGIVIQGAGCDVSIERVSIAKSVRQSLRFDDGVSPRREQGQGRYWDHNGVSEGPGAANGHIWIRDLAIEGEGEIANIHAETALGGVTWPHDVARSFTMVRSGLYGQTAYAKFPGSVLESGQALIGNTPPLVEAYCRDELGMDTVYPASISS